MKLWKKSETLKKPPIKAAHSLQSMIYSAHDDHSFASKKLIDLALFSAQIAAKTDLKDLSSRLTSPPYYPDVWPGEHYKLLAGIVFALQPKKIIEIGTATGLSSLALLKNLPSNGKLISYDLASWEQLPNTVLTEKDFLDQRLEHRVGDLSQEDFFTLQSEDLKDADLIFIDATHDGILELQIFERFKTLDFTPIIVLDDIRFWTMLKMWRSIQMPKLDLTSFGHWSGTGLIEWQSSPINAAV